MTIYLLNLFYVDTKNSKINILIKIDPSPFTYNPSKTLLKYIYIPSKRHVIITTRMQIVYKLDLIV